MIMDSKDFISIFNYFSDKIDSINDLIPLVKACRMESLNGTDENVESLTKLSYLAAIVQEMEEMLSIVDSELDRQKIDIITKREEILRKIDSIRDHSNHLIEFKGKYQIAKKAKEVAAAATAAATKTHHVPSHRVTSKVVTKNEPRTKKATHQEQSTKVKQPAIEYKAPKNRDIPIIEPINKDEFDEIPQYMRGRITHQSLNQGLAAFMETISSKYSLLSTHSSRYSEDDMKRAQLYKSQENAETVGQLFCTTDDLKLYSNLKETNTTKIVLTCLRHCKRIKEIRGPGKLIRYALIKP